MQTEHSIRVLVVEDEMVAAAYIRRKLHDLSYEVIGPVASGEQALQLLEEQLPDVILMDIVLEGKLDGIDTAAIVQEKYGIPVIYLTSYSDEQKISRALTSQPFGYILKPIQERELHANIRMSLYKAAVDKKLKRSEEQTRAILQNSPMAIISTDTDFNLEFANNRFLQLFGLQEKAELAGKNLLDIILPDSELLKQFSAVINSEFTASGYTVRTRNFSNRQIAYRVSASKLQGYPGGFEFFLEDLTEKEYFENEAKKAESKFRSLFFAPGNPFILIDGDFKIEIFNEAANLLAGVTTGVSLSNGMLLTTAFSGLSNQFEGLLPQLHRGESTAVDMYYSLPEKQLSCYEFLFTKITEDESGHTNYSISIKDITERKDYESSLRNYIAQLEDQQNKLEHQSVELYYLNEKLLYSEDNLKKLNANKDKFFSIIAHDLRSPFNTLLGFTEYLLEDFDLLDRETIRSIAGDLNKSIKRVFELLENLLHWSRIQAQRVDFIPEEISLNEMTGAIIKLYGPVAAKKMVHIYPEIPENTRMTADPNMLSSMMQNLVSNAIKFTHKGGWVRLSYELQEDAHVISTSDNGIGMSKDIISKLFKIEENVSRYGTEQEAGTGLGLVLCKEFAEFHHGRLEVNSEEGKGTVFTIYIPVVFENTHNSPGAGN